MYRDLAGSVDPKEDEMALEFEEAGARHARLRVRGAAAPLRQRLRTDPARRWTRSSASGSPRRWPSASGARRLVLELDDAVSEAVARLKERGFDSPYLKAFVVARVNPLRFMKGDAPPFDELFAQMTKRARGMDPGKIRGEDVARSGGAAAEAE